MVEQRSFVYCEHVGGEGVVRICWVVPREGAELNIRVHTLALGAVETQMFRKIVSEEEIL